MNVCASIKLHLNSRVNENIVNVVNLYYPIIILLPMQNMTTLHKLYQLAIILIIKQTYYLWHIVKKKRHNGSTPRARAKYSILLCRSDQQEQGATHCHSTVSRHCGTRSRPSNYKQTAANGSKVTATVIHWLAAGQWIHGAAIHPKGRYITKEANALPGMDDTHVVRATI